jgi:sugar/nucleoside kinase (ribokinase family)
MGITISGVGCSLLDLIYTDIDFGSRGFDRLSSKKPGDGGLVPGGLVFVEDLERFANSRLNHILETITGKSGPDSINLGGPAIAALVNAGQLCHGHPIDIRFFAMRGNDTLGRQIERILAQTAVNIDHYLISEGVSPATIVLSDPSYGGGAGERSFINTLGVAANYGVENLDSLFFDADLLFFGATAIVPEIHAHLDDLLQRGKANGSLNVVATVYDFKSEHRDPKASWPLVSRAENLKLIDLLIMNGLEACRISGRSDPAEGASYFAAKGVGTVLITRGSNPVLACSNGSLFEAAELRTLPVSERLSQELLAGQYPQGDTTGCGDNFAGGVIADLAIQLQTKAPGFLDLDQACAWGICSGALAGTYAGGVYAESRPGEKAMRLKPYVDHYLQQIEKSQKIHISPTDMEPYRNI